jgi:hypothetical protein
VKRGAPKKVVAKEVINVDEVVAGSQVASSVITFFSKRDRTRPLHHDDAHSHLLSKPSIQNYYISKPLLTAETITTSETYKGNKENIAN